MISLEFKGDFDVDSFPITFDCPFCQFLNTVTFKQFRIRDVIICRGCKANILLLDQLNTCRKAEREVRREMQRFRKTVEDLNKQLRRIF